MADDRVFIKCECGAQKMLLKYFAGQLGTRDNGILEWIDAHCECHPNLYYQDLNSKPGFFLITESDSAFVSEKLNALPAKAIDP